MSEFGAFHATALTGHILALSKTGYEKTDEFTTGGGNKVVVYQNVTLGKVVVLVFYTETQEWIALYPMTTCIDGELRSLVMCDGGMHWALLGSTHAVETDEVPQEVPPEDGAPEPGEA